MIELNKLLYNIFLRSPNNFFNELLIECQKSYAAPAHNLQEIHARKNTKIKGDMFEEFSVLYLKNVKKYNNVWLLKDVPEDILEKLNIPHICEKNMIFKKYNYTLEKEFNPRVDILLDQYKLVIEVNGSFWHANPKKYKPEDTFPTFYGKMSAKEIWLKDQIKKNHIESFGYIVETIWDDEITKENISNLLKRYENKTNN